MEQVIFCRLNLFLFSGPGAFGHSLKNNENPMTLKFQRWFKIDECRPANIKVWQYYFSPILKMVLDHRRVSGAFVKTAQILSICQT
jgi:hypothetical protein